VSFTGFDMAGMVVENAEPRPGVPWEPPVSVSPEGDAGDRATVRAPVHDDLLPFGWGDRWVALFASATEGADAALPGRVVRHDGVAVLVATEDGTDSLPVLASVDPAPVVGDWVVVDANTRAVVDVLPRSSLLRRQDPDGGEQALVANLDVLLIVCGLDRPVKPGRIQRSTALAWDAGATPVVVLTKADLADDPEAVAAEVAAGNPGVDVVVSSSQDGRGVEEVQGIARDRTIVLLGESGAGKSTLANALVGDEVTATAAVREGDAKGRHTTTRRELHVLPTGGVLIDTPGIRAVGLWVDPDAVAATFDDIEELAHGCRFNDCAHAGEPGCAVAAAVEAGDLAPERLEAWHTLQREAVSAARRADEHARRTYERRFGKIVKEAQERKRPG
jgi:ribosome biogenesis GTPase